MLVINDNNIHRETNMTCDRTFRNALPRLAAMIALILSSLIQAQPVVQGGDHSAGEAIYQQHCAACHDNPEETKSPAADSLKRMGARPISYALTHGKMRVQGSALSEPQIDAVVGYLAASVVVDNSWVARMSCPADRQAVDTGAPTVGGFGIGMRNHRNMSAAQAGLHKTDMGNLQLQTAIGFPQTANMRSQPAVVGNTLYLIVPDAGQLFAFDIDGSPCVKWVYEHPVPLRTAIQVGDLDDGRQVLLFGDAAAHIQMFDPVAREVLWRTSIRISSVSNSTGMPVLYQGRVYAPVSSGELNMGAAPDYECCTSHGGVVAMDASSGEVIWIYRTMEEATPQGISRVGTQQWGPSGAPIWTTPAIDEKRGVLYVGTGQNTSAPATDTSDAVLAINLEDGSLKWKFQATENDIFLTGCMFQPDGPNCPPDYSLNVDWDFGASMVIAERPDGSDLILAGQKSGTLWALNPDSGELLWSNDVGPGGPAGGIHWGMAYDGERLFVPVNQTGMAGEDPDREPGLHAIDVATGKTLWSYYNSADCTGDRQQHLPSCGRNYGLSAATLLVDGAVIQGGNDGFVRIFDGDNGSLLFSFDTARPFETINGIEGKGGAIDNAVIIAANGKLIVQSGYGLMGAAGNLLLIFGSAD
jgi:polyvinyl alcohol dehydrogenase (cytochrome)